MNSGSTITRSNGGRLTLVAALLATGLLVSLFARLGNVESAVYDTLQRYQYQPASERILLVTTDADNGDGANTWSASGFSSLVARLDQLDAGVIAATQPLVLPELPPEEQIAALTELERQAARSGDTAGDLNRLAAQLQGFRKNYDDQQKLARTLAAAGNVVLSIHPSEYSGRDQLRTECAEHRVNLQGADSDAITAAPVSDPLLLPPAAVCAASRAIGFSATASASSGRTNHLLVDANGVLLPSLALATLAATEGNNQDIVVASAAALTLKDRVIHTGRGFGVMPRSYFNRDGSPTFASVSSRDVLDGAVDASVVSGRIVLIGARPDDRGSSLIAAATGLSNLLDSDYVLRHQWLTWIEYGLIMALLVLVLAWVPAMPAIGALLVGLVMATIVLSIEAWLLVSERIWVQFGTAALFAALAVWVSSIVRARNALAAAAARRIPSADIGARAGSAAEELDLQFSVLRQQPVTDDSKEKMYQIAFQHGRAEEFARAERVLRFIYQHDPDYKDVGRLLEQLSGQKNYQPLAKNKASEKPTDASHAAQADRESPREDSSGTKMLGRYTIEKKLGEGAMATVYLGTDSKIGRKVAIKTVALAEEFDDAKLEDARQQFLREAESAGRLNHPNIIAIYDVGEDKDVSYLAMEYFDGVSLLKHAQRDDLLPASWVMELVARAAEALDYAHRQGVVHRDIKPANIMYHAASDEVKLTDFGIARLTDTSRTKTGIILGTPSFMSPEQLTGSAVTGQSDLYSLGVTLYQLLTGVAPFRADSIPKLMDKIMSEEPRPVREMRDNLPECVDSIISVALAKDPEDRYSSGRAMAMALRDCAKRFGSYS